MRKSFEIAKEHFKNKKSDYNAVIGVEIGVLQGRNAKEMLEGFPKLSILHLVDPYTGRYPNYYPDAHKYLKEYTDRIVWHVIDSIHAANLFGDGVFDFVYIDDGHSYDLVKGDVDRWWPKVRASGMLCGHDYISPSGVKEAVDEFVARNNLTLYKCEWKEPGDEADWWTFK